MTDTKKIIKELTKRFKSESALNEELIFQINITDAENFYIHINKGSCEIKEGLNNNANVTLITNQQTLLDILTEKTNGMQAFMSGKLKTEGNMMLAGKLTQFFTK